MFIKIIIIHEIIFARENKEGHIIKVEIFESEAPGASFERSWGRPPRKKKKKKRKKKEKREKTRKKGKKGRKKEGNYE